MIDRGRARSPGLVSGCGGGGDGDGEDVIGVVIELVD